MKRRKVKRLYRWTYRYQKNRSVRKPIYEVVNIDVIQLLDGTLWIPMQKIYNREMVEIFLRNKELVEEYDTSDVNPLF